MGAGAVLSCILAIATLILMTIGRVSAWALVPMIVLTECVVYKAFASTVRHRRRDVALLRCFGASRAQVFNGILAEAAWLGVIGAVAGLGGVLFLLNILRFETSVAALFIGAIGAVLAAVVPAIRASKIPPSGPSTVA
ncbi:FtsX-like permease family protein [Kibdelosporangium philippinense]